MHGDKNAHAQQGMYDKLFNTKLKHKASRTCRGQHRCTSLTAVSSSSPLFLFFFLFIWGDHAHLKQSLTTRDTHVPSGRGKLHMSPKGKGDTQLASGRGKLHMGPKGKGDTQLASGRGKLHMSPRGKGTGKLRRAKK